MSDLQRRLQMNRLPPMPPAGVGGAKPSAGKKGFGHGRRDYTPVAWDKYFMRKEDVIVGKSIFRVYENGTEGPVCLFLHGGGFSALSWALLSKMLPSMVKCRCFAFDARGHGDTWTDDDSDLSAETMAKDVGDVVGQFYGYDPPPIILVGHSMGGAIAVHTAQQELLPTLIGLAVIDVVEGSALDALASMQSFLRGRPSMFRSIEHAIEWCVRTGQIRNIDSARVSMVGQLKSMSSDQPATAELQQTEADATVSGTSAIQEETEDDTPSSQNHTAHQNDQSSVFPSPADSSSSTSSSSPSSSSQHYTWRIDLTKTEPYWRGWFEGLSQRFLSTFIPKMLLLAGVDRLDRDLTVGQMQGKFQMQVLPKCGHAVHEDVPEKVADVLATFMVRHKVAQPTADFERTFPAC